MFPSPILFFPSMNLRDLPQLLLLKFRTFRDLATIVEDSAYSGRTLNVPFAGTSSVENASPTGAASRMKAPLPLTRTRDLIFPVNNVGIVVLPPLIPISLLVRDDQDRPAAHVSSTHAAVLTLHLHMINTP